MVLYVLCSLFFLVCYYGVIGGCQSVLGCYQCVLHGYQSVQVVARMCVGGFQCVYIVVRVFLDYCYGILCCSWVFQVDAGVLRLLLGCVYVISRVFRWLLGCLVGCYSVLLGCAMLFLGVQVVARVLGFCQVVLCGYYSVLGNHQGVKVVNLVFRWLLARFRLLLGANEVFGFCSMWFWGGCQSVLDCLWWLGCFQGVCRWLLWCIGCC